MAKKAFTSVAAYIAAQPKPAHAALRSVRAAIRKALPGAEEMISYNVPTYRLDGRAALYFAGWKTHYSLYPASDALIAAIARSSFRSTGRCPIKLIARIAKLRAKEQVARGGGSEGFRPAAVESTRKSLSTATSISIALLKSF